MIKATKKDTGSFVYMKLKKHPCPKCGEVMKRVKMKKVVKANTKEAAGFDLSVANVSLGEKVKFIWYELKCNTCDCQYTEDALKKLEKKLKEDAAKAKKAQKKAAAKAKKSLKKDAAKARKAEKKANAKAEKNIQEDTADNK